MLIAIISDIHDNIVNLEKCLVWCRQNKVANLVCCGDITTFASIHYLSKNFAGKIFVVTGNAEIYQENEIIRLKNINFCGEIGINEIAGLKIGFCHEPKKIKKVEKLSSWPLDYIFYGHTHQPWLEKDDNTLIINPGTVAGLFAKATFAVLDSDTKKLSLKIIDDL